MQLREPQQQDSQVFHNRHKKSNSRFYKNNWLIALRERDRFGVIFVAETIAAGGDKYTTF